MRLVVACLDCNRQYDASGLAVGRRFHCHCGAVLAVQAPRGHDAAVVCCSSCGAPRRKGSLNCEHCDSDFTLHERDLHTVCPNCLTRVSDRARFCHSCGKPIAPEMVAGEKSDLRCPECGPEYLLMSRARGEVSVLECDRCAGLWMSSAAFKRLTEAASDDAMNLDSHQWATRARAGRTDLAPRNTKRYRPCALCSQLMVRRMYGRRSGVIIDVCKDHGIWFDADELPRILHWVRSGGLARANRDKAREAARKDALRGRRPVGMAGLPREFANTDDGTVAFELSTLLKWFFD